MPTYNKFMEKGNAKSEMAQQSFRRGDSVVQQWLKSLIGHPDNCVFLVPKHRFTVLIFACLFLVSWKLAFGDYVV